MRYADLKKERDEAIARAIEAERLSMKSEFDKLAAEHEQERFRSLALVESGTRERALDVAGGAVLWLTTPTARDATATGRLGLASAGRAGRF